MINEMNINGFDFYYDSNIDAYVSKILCNNKKIFLLLLFRTLVFECHIGTCNAFTFKNNIFTIYYFRKSSDKNKYINLKSKCSDYVHSIQKHKTFKYGFFTIINNKLSYLDNQYNFRIIDNDDISINDINTSNLKDILLTDTHMNAIIFLNDNELYYDNIYPLIVLSDNYHELKNNEYIVMKNALNTLKMFNVIEDNDVININEKIIYDDSNSIKIFDDSYKFAKCFCGGHGYEED